MPKRSFRERLPEGSWCLLVGLCASIVISCSLFSVFYTMVIMGRIFIGPVEAVRIWLIPFLTSLVAGLAIGNIKRAIKTSPLIVIGSFLLTVALSSLPVILGIVSTPPATDTIVLLAIQYNVYLLLLSFAAILGGTVIGGFRETE